VTTIFIQFNILEIPFKCNAIIRKSTGTPGWLADNGGYKVHPLAAPPLTKVPLANNIQKKEAGNNQNQKLFILGKAKSDVPNCKGIIKLP
jgi:hypothetical protein